MSISSILCIGQKSGTCLDRADALRRLGYGVELIDLRSLLPQTTLIVPFTLRFGGHWFEPLITRALPRMLSGKRFDLCLVDSGEWVTPQVVRLLRAHSAKVIHLTVDDPFGTRDRKYFEAFLRSVPSYDLCIVVRAENIAEAKAFGAKAVMRIYRSADEVSHAPRPLTEHDHRLWSSEVLFLGTWFPERGPFLLELLKRGVPLTIRGSRWEKAPEWRKLKPHIAGGALWGDEYAKAIQCARVNLGLLSKGNRDLHTQRSLEIPALGGLLCAERTAEHVAMYEEDSEALFWADPEECAEKCSYALSHEEARLQIAAAGHRRVRSNEHYNEPILRAILDRVAKLA
jgi:spore maturation protein CgeB